MHNVGAAFRNADAFGIKEIYISGYTPQPPRPEITKTAIGAEEHVSWEAIDDPFGKIETLKNSGYQSLVLNKPTIVTYCLISSQINRKYA